MSGPAAGIAIVLGSGLGGLADRSERVWREVPFSEAGLPASSVPGHEGKFLLAGLAGRPVWLMKGRVHLYEGHSSAQATAGVRWLAAQGVRTLILTNAAGALNASFAPGEWMMLSDHLNLTGTSPLIGGPHFHDMSHVYDPVLRGHFRRLAAAQGMALREGVYAGVLGPQYETPAEVRMLCGLGADAVGMSTVLEAIQARALGLRVAGFSCLTNMGAGLAAETLHHGEVVATGLRAADRLASLLTAWLRSPETES